jgi:peptidyl-Asp metalloendopeptidase
MSTLGKIIVALTTLAATVAPAAARDLTGAGRALKPVTWGIEQADTARLQQVAFAAGAGKALPRLPSSRQGEIVIDLLVAYTRKAARHYYEIERDVVELAIEEANHSFRLSGIGHIRLRLAHAFQTGYTERGAHFDHLWRMADKEGEHMARIHALREAYRADVAILIVDDAKGCGLATRIGADADEAFAVVHHGCAVSSYTLAHEVGHIMGARHELAYVSGTAWRDIMSYKDACDGCPRLPVWSNPLVRIGGEPAGTTELNNARIIAQNAWRVASFR